MRNGEVGRDFGGAFGAHSTTELGNTLGEGGGWRGGSNGLVVMGSGGLGEERRSLEVLDDGFIHREGARYEDKGDGDASFVRPGLNSKTCGPIFVI